VGTKRGAMKPKPGAMPSPWLAVAAGVDSRARARQLRLSWERLLVGHELNSQSASDAAADVRQPIVDSWRRSLDSGLDPVGWLAPIEADPSEIRERWVDHPLGSLTRVLRDQLETMAEDSQSLIVVSDATGLLLYVGGSEWLKERAAADMNFLEGARWNEAAAGTNAIGTALAADHALQVFASEHFNQREHRWTCSAAPVHDPLSGRVVGIVDLTGPWKTVHPASLPLVTGAARTMEQCLVDARRDHDARLRRRYADLATRATDLLVSPDGYYSLASGSRRSRSHSRSPKAVASSACATAQSPPRSRSATARRTSFAVSAGAASEPRSKLLTAPRDVRGSYQGDTPCGMRAILDSL
jgi:transcriptional regulator of acetoin/glycerol metabolism